MAKWDMWQKKLKMLAESAWGEISRHKKFILVGDNDLDGIMSTFIMKNLLERKKKEILEVYFDEHNFEKDRAEKFLKEMQIRDTAIIFMDLPIDPNLVLDLGLESRVIIVDHHHEGYAGVSFLFDPRNEKMNPVPSTSEFVYNIARVALRVRARDLLPFAALGALGDYMFYTESGLANELSRIYPSLYDGSFTPAFFSLYLIATIFLEKPYILLNHFKNPVKLVETFRDDFITRGVDFLLSISNFEVQEAGEIIVVKTKKASKVASNMPFYAVYGEKPLVAYSEQGNLLKISLRVPPKLGIHAGRVMKEFTGKYGVVGGGHPEAAGGKIEKKMFQKFLSYLKSILKSSKARKR